MLWLALPALLFASPPDASTAAGSARPKVPARAQAAYCTGRYSDDFAALSKAAVELSQKPESQFTSCVRVTATYECISYGGDGNLKRSRQEVTAHGTAFAYRRQGSETLLATNTHVIEYPPVTNEDHPVTGVPNGCKKISDRIRIVDNEKDTFESDDVPLTRVVSDAAKDLAVVKAKSTTLRVMPWAIGKSSALRERNVVDVRGFPLGAFKATNVGKVISTLDRDDYKEWDHDDFVIDALLSPGNSGSPVLAVNCATGEYELVGVYHADYARGSALNVVIHVDGLRELLLNLKKDPDKSDPAANLDRASRERVAADAATGLYFPFGSLTAAVRARSDGTLVLLVYGKDFPMDAWPVAVLEDLPPADALDFGAPGRFFVSDSRGLVERSRSELDPEGRALLERSHEQLRRLASLAAAHQQTSADAELSRQNADRHRALERAIRRVSQAAREDAAALDELADRELKHSPHTYMRLSALIDG